MSRQLRRLTFTPSPCCKTRQRSRQVNLSLSSIVLVIAQDGVQNEFKIVSGAICYNPTGDIALLTAVINDYKALPLGSKSLGVHSTNHHKSHCMLYGETVWVAEKQFLGSTK